MIIHLSRHGTVFNFYAPNTRQVGELANINYFPLDFYRLLALGLESFRQYSRRASATCAH
jgi:hypothetical protein